MIKNTHFESDNLFNSRIEGTFKSRSQEENPELGLKTLN